MFKMPLIVPVVMIACLFLSGCSAGMRAIENRNLNVSAKMSDTIFLDAETLTSTPKIFVRVANTSDFQDIDFAALLRQQLQGMGYQITGNAREAAYHVQANLLYLGEKKEGMDPDAVLKAGFGSGVIAGTLAGLTGSSLRGAGSAGLITGLAVAGGEALAGHIFHVDEFFGMVDVQIKEEVEGGVTGIQMSQLQDGTSTTTQTTRNVESKRQEYRTRIVVQAKQTRMDKQEACNIISDRLANQIAGMFRL